MSNIYLSHKKIIDVVKYRWVWLSLSLLLIVPGIVAMVYSMLTYSNHMPLLVGIDFTGGSIAQYAVNKTVDNAEVAKLRDKLTSANIVEPVIQILNSNNPKDKDLNIISIKTQFASEKNDKVLDKVTGIVKADYPDAKLVQLSSVGPTLGKELFKNSMVALALAFIAITLYLAFRFRLEYGLIAIFAMFHDVLFVVGIFSLLGLLFGVHIDSLFITAVLTVVGFSVHDTIVVFDRIRENSKFLAKKATFGEIVNASVNQTLTRSINTSLTVLITLAALYFFGGVTTKDFVLAMILGIAIGTYSSIFFASMALAWYKEKQEVKVRS